MLRWSVHLQGAPKVYDDATVAVGGASVYSFGGCSPGGGGGVGGSDQIHVNVFNAVTLLWTRLPAVTGRRGRRPRRVPSWRYGHTAVLIEERVYVFGGITYIEDFCKNRPYAFNVDTHRWLRLSVAGISGVAPAARSGHSAVAVGRVMYVYGGDTWSSAAEAPSDDRDVYKLDTAGSMAWSVVRGGARGGGGGVASAWHSATVIGTRMFVFGGEGGGAEGGERGEGGDAYNYVRVFDTETDAWLATPPGASPSAGLLPHQGRRKYHSAFAHQGELYVLGGGGGRSKRPKKRRRSSRSLWRFDAQAFSWSRVRVRGEGPVNTWMCCCPLPSPAGGGGGWRVVLFGGFRGYARVDDLYVLDVNPSLKTLSKLTVIGHGLERSEELPHDLRWELDAMTGNHRHGGGARSAKRKRKRKGRRRKRKC